MALPLVVAAGMALAAAAPGIISAIKGNGDKPQIGSPDANSYKVYGTDATGKAHGEQGRATKAAQIDYGQTNADAQGVRNQGAGLDGLGSQLMDMAQGNGPSLARTTLQQGTDQAIAANQAIANSARGGALGLAQGQLLASNQSGQVLANRQAQANQIAMQEQQAALNGMISIAVQRRAQDLQLAGLSAQQAQYQAQMEAAQRSQNDQYALGMQGLNNQMSIAQSNANIAYEDAKLRAQGAQVGQYNADRAIARQDQAAAANAVSGAISAYGQTSSQATPGTPVQPTQPTQQKPTATPGSPYDPGY